MGQCQRGLGTNNTVGISSFKTLAARTLTLAAERGHQRALACLNLRNEHVAAENRDLRGLIDVWGAWAMVSLAHRRVWRHGAGGRGAPGLPQRARSPARGGPARAALFEQLLAQEYAKGSALKMAARLEIDAVIDQADAPDWLVKGLQVQPAPKSSNQLAIDGW